MSEEAEKVEYTEEYTEELAKQEEVLAESDDSSGVPPEDIVAFNELRSCADLVRMYETDQLDIKPDFQRTEVWSKASQTRFIDSLVKQLPIPSMCISYDYKTGKRLMIDGLQRISSIIYFLTDDQWKLSKLDDVDVKISNKKVAQIKEKNPEIYSRVENLSIPITVVRSDYSKKNHMQYLFTIFHRLNTGGNKLNNQEIRNCIFQGSFNTLLRKQLVLYSNYRKLFGLQDGNAYRFAHEERILRFFSLHDRFEEYTGRLAKFLNSYMDEKRYMTDEEISRKRHLFERTVDILYQGVGKFPKLSIATAEGIFIGVSRNIDKLEKEFEGNKNVIREKIEKLRNDVLYSVDNLKEGIAQKDKVIDRLTRAVEIFSE